MRKLGRTKDKKKSVEKFVGKRINSESAFSIKSPFSHDYKSSLQEKFLLFFNSKIFSQDFWYEDTSIFLSPIP